MSDRLDKAYLEIESLRQRVKELEDYLREVAVEAGLPPETLDIATCKHIAHQVKYIRNAAVQYMEELAALKQTQGEPVVWRLSEDGEWGYTESPTIAAVHPHATPLYTSAPSIPEGWKLVPVEPTEDMVFCKFMGDPTDWYAIWEAMLAAAPKPDQ